MQQGKIQNFTDAGSSKTKHCTSAGASRTKHLYIQQPENQKHFTKEATLKIKLPQRHFL